MLQSDGLLGIRGLPEMERCLIYYPPPYRPRLLPRLVSWTLLAVGCFLFVGASVLLMWVLDGFVN